MCNSGEDPVPLTTLQRVPYMNNLESQLLEHYLHGVKMKDLIEMNKGINPAELQRIVNKVIGFYLQSI